MALVIARFRGTPVCETETARRASALNATAGNTNLRVARGNDSYVFAYLKYSGNGQPQNVFSQRAFRTLARVSVQLQLEIGASWLVTTTDRWMIDGTIQYADAASSSG